MQTLLLFSAQYLIFVILVIAGIFFFASHQKKRMIITGLISLPLTGLIGQIMAFFYFDPRPFVVHHFVPLIPHAPDNGFPSDHALLSFAVATLVFVFNKKLGWMLGILGILVGVSRILLGLHSPIDVIGSFIISIGSMAGAFSVLNGCNRKE